MWGQGEQGSRPASEAPEIRRIDLSEIALSLYSSSIEDIDGLPWLDAPDTARWDHAIDLLQMLGALNHSRQVTELGKRMSTFA